VRLRLGAGDGVIGGERRESVRRAVMQVGPGGRT